MLASQHGFPLSENVTNRNNIWDQDYNNIDPDSAGSITKMRIDHNHGQEGDMLRASPPEPELQSQFQPHNYQKTVQPQREVYKSPDETYSSLEQMTGRKAPGSGAQFLRPEILNFHCMSSHTPLNRFPHPLNMGLA